MAQQFLNYEAMIDDFEILHEGNHTKNVKGHTVFAPTIPQYKTSRYETTMGDNNYIKLLEYDLKENQRIKLIVRVCNLGNSNNITRSTVVTLEGNITSTGIFNSNYTRDVNDVPLTIIEDDIPGGKRITLYGYVEINFGVLGVMPMIEVSNPTDIVIYHEGATPQPKPVGSEAIINGERFVVQRFNNLSGKNINNGELIITDSDMAQKQMGKFHVKLKNRFNGFSTVEIPSRNRFVGEHLEGNVIPDVSNYSDEDTGHIVVTKRNGESDKPFMIIRDKNGNLVARNIQVIDIGDTNERPTTLIRGYSFFDTRLGKPIWYNGDGNWIDANGNPI